MILVVDDVSSMRLELSSILQGKGYRITEAISGKETIGIIASNKIDLVLMDALMDEMDGFTACRIIKENPESKNIPVLMVTSLDDNDSINLAFAAGADDYITKPVNYAVLYHRLEKIFRNLDQEEQIVQQQAKLKSLLEIATVENSYKRNILEAMTDGLFVVTADGIIETANRAAHILLKYKTTEDMVGVHMDTVCHPQDSAEDLEEDGDDYGFTTMATLTQSALNSSLTEIKTYLNTADNKILPVIISGSTMKESGSTALQYLFSFKDMTAQKGADAALWQAKVDIESANKKLAKLNDTLMEERAIIENVVSKIHHSPLFDPENLRILEKAVEKTTGDIICSTSCAQGSRRVLLGDFTGHGLIAAIGGPLISEIFYSETTNCIPMATMFRALNERLLFALPEDMFMACSCVELNLNAMEVTLFNAGLANIFIIRNGKIIHQEPSAFVPRGLMDVPDKDGVVVPVQKHDRIIMYTDGFEEATSPDGSMFGEERFIQILEQTISEDRPLQFLIDEVKGFCQGGELGDDMTLVELTC